MFEIFKKLFLVLAADILDGVADLMYDAELHGSVGEDATDGIQGAGLPFPNLRQHAVSDSTDGLCRQTGVELTLKIATDIIRTRAKGIHADNLVSHAIGKIVSRLRTV